MLTKENYEAWKQEYEKGISTDANRIMFETFEALREVAREAFRVARQKEDATLDVLLARLAPWLLEDERS